MKTPQELPGVAEHAGFPNPATDSSLQSLDLNKLLVHHRVSTYFMRVEGNGYRKYHILDGDVLLIDRALIPQSNDLAVWWRDDCFSVSPHHSIPQDCAVWGVVSSVIRQLKGASI